MLSSDLVAKYAGYIYLGKQKILVSPEDVYIASSLAQSEIIRDLRLLQDKTTIVFPSVEQSQRLPVAISNITGTTTVTVTTSVVHGYQTGEEVIMPSGLGYTGISGRRTITVTGTSAFTLNSTTGSGTYTSGGTVYPLISGLIDLVGGRQTSPNDILMTKVDYDQVNQDREDFVDGSVDTVFRIYQLETEPMTLGLQGVPSTSVSVEVRFYRVPTPNEDISSTVNPILADKYKRLLEVGTLCYIYEDLFDQELVMPMGRSTHAFSLSDKQRAVFDREKQRVQGSIMKSRIRTNSQPRGIRW